jgi:hypothetical protein
LRGKGSVGVQGVQTHAVRGLDGEQKARAGGGEGDAARAREARAGGAANDVERAVEEGHADVGGALDPRERDAVAAHREGEVLRVEGGDLGAPADASRLGVGAGVAGAGVVAAGAVASQNAAAVAQRGAGDGAEVRAVAGLGDLGAAHARVPGRRWTGVDARPSAAARVALHAPVAHAVAAGGRGAHGGARGGLDPAGARVVSGGIAREVLEDQRDVGGGAVVAGHIARDVRAHRVGRHILAQGAVGGVRRRGDRARGDRGAEQEQSTEGTVACAHDGEGSARRGPADAIRG